MKQALKINNHLDKHLKQLKSEKGEKSSLELATEGNGARISGDLEVTGYTDNIKLRSESIIQSDGNVTLDSSGDITLDAAGADIAFATGGTSYLTWSANGVLTMKAAVDVDDHFQITVTNTGLTVISTNDDSDGNLADLSLDIEGDITLNSGNGIFIMENDGTEFSVANSAYAGMILGYTTDGIDILAAYETLGTAMEVTDNDHNVSFIAPPSGVVEIFVSIYGDFARRTTIFGLSDLDQDTGYSPIDFPNSNDTTNEHVVSVPPSASGDRQINHTWVVTGLTPGTTYKWWLGAKTAGGSGGVLRWGGNVTNEYPPAIMRATALPAAVTDFAQYG